MKTDRELLELAANAAGIMIDQEYSGRSAPASLPDGYVVIINSSGGHSFWSPMKDNGDALRLASKLRLMIKPGKHLGDGCTVESQQSGIAGCTCFRDDPAEQMRVAIVRAAASIGEQMP